MARLALLALVALVALVAPAGRAGAAAEDLEDLVLGELAGYMIDEDVDGPFDLEAFIPLLPVREDGEALGGATRAVYARLFVPDGSVAVPPAGAVVVLLFELKDPDDVGGFVEGFDEGAQSKADYAAFAVPGLRSAVGARFGDGDGNLVEAVAVPRAPYALAVAALAGTGARTLAIEVAVAQDQRLRQALADDGGPGPVVAGDDSGTGAAQEVGMVVATVLLVGVTARLVLALVDRSRER
ncbi:MAG: hypothetical protein ACRD0Q_04130 [Acidimicrobiales bacterium]